jgi:hypothetical protein
MKSEFDPDRWIHNHRKPEGKGHRRGTALQLRVALIAVITLQIVNLPAGERGRRPETGIWNQAELYFPFEGAAGKDENAEAWKNRGTMGIELPTSLGKGELPSPSFQSHDTVRGQAYDGSELTASAPANAVMFGTASGSDYTRAELALRNTRSFTWCGWIKQTVPGTPQGRIFFCGPVIELNYRGSLLEFTLAPSTVGKDGGGTGVALFPPGIGGMDWTFVAVVYDSSLPKPVHNLCVYAGNQTQRMRLIHSGYHDFETLNRDPQLGSSFVLGNNGLTAARPFQGYLDEIRIFGDAARPGDGQSALSVDELEAIRRHDLQSKPGDGSGESPDGTVQIGNHVSQPSNTGTDWTPAGKVIYNLEVSTANARLETFGIDTEGGDRAKLNLLREPISLVFTLSDGREVKAVDLPVDAKVEENGIEYSLSPIDNVVVTWRVRIEGQKLKMGFAADGDASAELVAADLLFPFDPRAMGTSILTENWGEKGAVKTPLIINALDMGQLHLGDGDGGEGLSGRFTGSRLHMRVDLALRVLSSSVRGRSLEFEPAYLEKPCDNIPDEEWAKARRGLLSLIQLAAYWPANENGSRWRGSPGGIVGNNVVSDPVSVMMERNFQWLAGMGDRATVGGINLHQIAKRTIEYWLNERMNPDGSINYVVKQGGHTADSNVSILKAATDYYLSTRDRQFIIDNRARLERAVDFLMQRDVDDDRLIESSNDGNGDFKGGDTAYDTIASGWKNALVNGQAYKAFLGAARMMEDIGAKDLAGEYRSRALALRMAYNRTFYEPDKKRYIWWIGQDGRRHDYFNTLVQANAVLYGIADWLKEDTGIAHDAGDIMQALWDALDEAEYFDSKKNVRVDYMDEHAGDFPGFYWGIPNNLRDVPDSYNLKKWGSHEFPYYCNGGIFPQDTVATIMALDHAGMGDRAKLIKQQIFRRQHEGIFPNGSGFYGGVLNRHGGGISILKWDGTPTDYEGIISRDCSFLQTVVLEDDPGRLLFE